MLDLDTIMDRLQDDENTAVTIFNQDTNTFLCRNKTHFEILQDSDSVQKFFEELFAEGNTRMIITLRVKSETGFITEGEPLKANLVDNTEKPTPTTEHGSFTNSFGLGALDVMNLMVAKNDSNRLFTENEVLKSENKEHKKLIDELKEERLATKYSTDNTKGIHDMISGTIPHLPNMINALKGISTTGLNSPAYSSLAKENFATALHQIDDAIVTVLDSINKGLNTNTEFSNELATLLKKHNLWEV